MDIEEGIRSRVEAILTNDARNRAEVISVAGDETLAADPFEEERNLYQRILQTYRNSVSEVNHILEENVGFLSGYYRMVESIKGKDDFEEICGQIAECILEDFGAEYCSLLFLSGAGRQRADSFCVEVVREGQTFVRVHPGENLLGVVESGRIVAGMSEEASGFLNIEDVYKDSRFNTIDFPSVVRSMVCLPVVARGSLAGFVLMSHSRPRFFNDNHIRVLRIVASSIAHIMHLTGRRRQDPAPAEIPPPDTDRSETPGLSIVLLSFQKPGPLHRSLPLDQGHLRQIRECLCRVLAPHESLHHYGEGDLIAVLPGLNSASLPAKVRSLRQAYHEWRSKQSGGPAEIGLSLGFSSCENDGDLAHTLEMASQMMHPDTDEDLGTAVQD